MQLPLLWCALLFGSVFNISLQWLYCLVLHARTWIYVYSRVFALCVCLAIYKVSLWGKASPIYICMLMLVYFAFVLLQLYDKLQCTIYIKIPLLVECTWQSPTLCVCFCIVMCVLCCNVKSILWGKVQRQFKGDSPTCWHPHPHLLHREGRARILLVYIFKLYLIVIVTHCVSAFTSLHCQIVISL